MERSLVSSRRSAPTLRLEPRPAAVPQWMGAMAGLAAGGGLVAALGWGWAAAAGPGIAVALAASTRRRRRVTAARWHGDGRWELHLAGGTSAADARLVAWQTLGRSWVALEWRTREGRLAACWHRSALEPDAWRRLRARLRLLVE